MGLLWPPMRPPPLPPRASPCPHGKTVHASTNQAIPPPSPEHTGHCTRLRPSPTWENDPGKRARGLTVIPSAYSGRREALTPQYRASQSPVRACPESPETGSQASEHVASLWRGTPKTPHWGNLGFNIAEGLVCLLTCGFLWNRGRVVWEFGPHPNGPVRSIFGALFLEQNRGFSGF